MKAEPQPNYDVNRASGTDSDNGCWLRRLVRLRQWQLSHKILIGEIMAYALGLLTLLVIAVGAFEAARDWRDVPPLPSTTQIPPPQPQQSKPNN
jgi:hypothetical protein